jgi:hypothetical protein
MQELDKRITKLEYVVGTHESHLENLQLSTKELRDTLTAIESTLMQIKWIATGALLAVIFNSSGLGQGLWKLLV